jgi:general secretion pathway protein D
MASVGNPGWSSTVARRSCAIAAALVAIQILTSCSPATFGSVTFPTAANAGPPPEIDVLDKVRSMDIFPREPQQAAGGTRTTGGEHSHTAMYEGTVVSDVAEAHPRPAASGNGYDLNFENTPVATVAKVVLGDILNTGYTIDSRVQGTVSLVSVRPVPKSDIVFVLENALRLSGIVLVKDTAGYRLTPLGDAVGAGRVDAASASPEPGYGVSVVPLQYVSAQTIMKLMDSFATKPGSIRADATRNMLLVQGTGAERRTAVDTVMSFDVDWMRGQSVGIFPLNDSPPETVIAELEKIMDSGDSGLSQNVIKFQPMGRLNAILVVSRKPALLQTAATWIRRLDHADSARNNVHVYQVKYGDAKQMARVLNDMFTGGSSSSLDSADNQLAGGSGSSSTSSAANQSLNGNSSSSSLTGGLGSSGQNGSGGGLGGGTGSGLGSGNGSGNGGPLGGGQRGNRGGANAADSALDSRGNGQPLLPNVRITPDTTNNSLLIYADQENYRIIESTLRQMDQQPLQVAIDATIVEVTLTNELSYGVQFFLTNRNLGIPGKGSTFNTQSAVAPTPTTTINAAGNAVTSAVGPFINSMFPGFNFLLGSQNNPKMIIDALHAVTTVKVLSNPSLVVLNNQVASLQVGDSVPVSTGSANVLTTSNTIVNTIDYVNTGIILKVSPRVSANGTVRLDVEQEISAVEPTTAANALTPTLSERKVKSSISITSGQTVLLAGLISEQQNGDRSGIPGLDQIPLIGDALSSQDKTGNRTELIVFIRPQIIHNGSDAQMVAEELRSKLRGSVGATVNDVRVPLVPVPTVQ